MTYEQKFQAAIRQERFKIVHDENAKKMDPHSILPIDFQAPTSGPEYVSCFYKKSSSTYNIVLIMNSLSLQ